MFLYRKDISNRLNLHTKSVLLELQQTMSIEAYVLLKEEKPTKQLADTIIYLIRNPSDNHASPSYVSSSA